MLNLQKNIIYGPVNSRRLGTSLGLNILGNKIKVCSFDCVYCQYGWTGDWEDDKQDVHLTSVDEIENALIDKLKTIGFEPNYITFSGNGEATIHPKFADIVDVIINIRNKYSPSSKTAILSNSSEIYKKEIKQALAKLDERIMKLDAGLMNVFNDYNRPRKYVDLDIITEELASMKDVTIQTLFCKGDAGNYTQENINAWLIRIKKIKPLYIQIYSLDRGYPSDSIYPVNKDELNKIKAIIESEGIKGEVF